jgi:hypothetical protein
MELPSNLTIDISLLLFFVILSVSFNFFTIYISQGTISSYLVFQAIKNILVPFNIFIFFTTCLFLVPFLMLSNVFSWICSDIFFHFTEQLNLADVFLTITLFLLCIFSHIAYSEGSFKRYNFNLHEGGEITHYYQFSWEGLGSSLIPAFLNTLLIMPGMFVAYRT